MPDYSVFQSAVRSALGVSLVPEYKFHPTRKWKFDFAVPHTKLAIEVEGGVYSGGRHTRGTGYIGDMEKYNNATVMGWRVLRFTPQQLCKSDTLLMIQQAL